ncbi:hypothetical protein [Pseudocolwellia agarivorans]|uniref:hypothetical protein n=1 Tax=Pseudocolwellia agarivorans TaxID=1911682 RepID=UPI000984B424|nr:hypothetical protein [Pseudocolwellia agarivorans]
MKQNHRLDLINIMATIHETPSIINDHWDTVAPLLEELVTTAPEGLEGMATMICTHFNNALKFKDLKVVKFELESGLIKLNRYLQKLNAFKQD